MTATATPNADQADYWNSQAGPTWVAMQEKLDAQIAPLGLATIEALKPAEGEHILDVGCGCGASTLELAWRVDPEGSVTGVDISGPMLEIARRRAHEAGYEQVRFIQADVQTHPFEPGVFDAAFSRFGVMFFEDPTAAFANIRKAVKPGGRLAFLCWRAMSENPVMTLPMMAAMARLKLPPATPPDPHAPGPFAFADEARVRGILQGAGWADVAFTPHDERIGANSLADAMEVALRVGPLGALLREKPQVRDEVVDAVREAIAPFVTDAGVRMPSATWIVTAANPK